MGKMMKDVIKENPELNLDTFGEIIDEFLEKSDYKMLLHMPEGTQDVTIQDNVGAGPVIWLYALIAALKPTLKGISILDRNKAGDFLDNILALVNDEVLRELKQEEGET